MAKKKAAASIGSKIQVTEDGPDEGPSKSQLIRAAIADNPQAGPKEVAEIVSKQLGQEVKASYVSIIKSQDKKKAGGGKVGGRGPGKRGPKAGAAKSNGKTPYQQVMGMVDYIVAAKALVKATGSAEQAKRLIDVVTSDE